MAKITDAIDPGNAGGSVLIPAIPTTPNRPITFNCDRCGKTFLDREKRRQHIFDRHPFKRAQLMVDSRAINERGQVITSSFPPEDWVIQQAECIEVDQREMNDYEARHLLSQFTAGFHEVKLTCAATSIVYNIEFDIPTEAELAAVEKSFNTLIVNQPLLSERIAQFITVSKQEGGAKLYIQGISDFLYGILAKDQRGGTGLAFEDYTSKYHSAREALRFMDRPLANLIKALVNFNDNAFESAALFNVAGQIGVACDMLFGLRSGNHFSAPDEAIAASHSIPVDTVTSVIMRFCSLPLKDQLDQLSFLENLSKKATPHDVLKIQALAMNACWEAGLYSTAAEWAKRLRHNPLFEALAHRILEEEVNG